MQLKAAVSMPMQIKTMQSIKRNVLLNYKSQIGSNLDDPTTIQSYTQYTSKIQQPYFRNANNTTMNVHNDNLRLYQTYGDKMNQKSTDQIRDATLSFLYASQRVSNEESSKSPVKFRKIVNSSMNDSKGLPTDSQREMVPGQSIEDIYQTHTMRTTHGPRKMFEQASNSQSLSMRETNLDDSQTLMYRNKSHFPKKIPLRANTAEKNANSQARMNKKQNLYGDLQSKIQIDKMKIM